MKSRYARRTSHEQTSELQHSTSLFESQERVEQCRAEKARAVETDPYSLLDEMEKKRT